MFRSRPQVLVSGKLSDGAVATRCRRQIRRRQPCLLAAQLPEARFGTSVLILTLRTPALLAQQLSTMSRLTERPFSFGVGTGWLRDTYDAPGMPFEQRGSTATSW